MNKLRDLRNNKALRGYCSHQDFGGNKIPVPIQNIALKNYCQINSYNFLLSRNEFYENNDDYKNCFFTLNSILQELPVIKGIVMMSYTMLPQSYKKRKTIFSHLLKTNSSFHFVIENLVVKEQKDIDWIENLISLIRVQKILNYNNIFKLIKEKKNSIQDSLEIQFT